LGHQQFFFAILGVVIVGIAIAVGVTMFKGNAIESSRSALINDLMYLASRARSQYWKPRVLAGASRDFTNIEYRRISTMSENENGRYYIQEATKDELVLVGVGRVVSGNDTIRIRMHVNERKNLVEIIN
jgi:hypothetical protein